MVRQPDGNLMSTPFIVKFGKKATLQAMGKTVDVEINGKATPLSMFLDELGIAHFPAASGKRAAAAEAMTGHKLSKRTLGAYSGLLSSLIHNLFKSTRTFGRSGRAESCGDGAVYQDVEMVWEAARGIPPTSLDKDDGLTAGSTWEEVIELSPGQLASCNLRAGVNEAIFSVPTRFQGEEQW